MRWDAPGDLRLPGPSPALQAGGRLDMRPLEGAPRPRRGRPTGCREPRKCPRRASREKPVLSCSKFIPIGGLLESLPDSTV